MAFTQSDLDAIRRAIAAGERSVQFSDRVVTYRSTQELLLAEERISKALTNRGKQTLLVGGKGF